ncbi:hypothetical protein X975_05336, partial [Stegodyphus mimosarum]
AVEKQKIIQAVARCIHSSLVELIISVLSKDNGHLHE